MSIWKEQSAPKGEPTPMSPIPPPKMEASPRTDVAPTQDLPRRAAEREVKESLVAADLTIEGKIEGSGHVRIAGRFKGDINVQGHLTIEVGAKVTGAVRANAVIIAGELEGNIDAAARVELLDTGVLNGDLKAGSLTVAAGSRMRGQVEFGWDEKSVPKAALRMEMGSAS
jgi:cytoskeletal protein CcmA (bactofilin family)